MTESRIPLPNPKIPEVAAVQGRVGVFIGSGYRLMTVATTREFIARLIAACDEAERSPKT